jgi:hypothetical protein
MAEELISSYIDRAAIKADTDFFLSQIKTVFEAYTNLGNTKTNLSFADGVKNTTNGISQLNEALKETTTISKEASKATAEEAKILALAAKAAKDAAAEKKLLAQAAAAEAKASAENAKVKAEEAKALKELYNAEKAEASSLKELAQVEKLEAQTRKENAAAALKEQQLSGRKEDKSTNDIPYTNNLAELEAEQAAALKTGEVVADLEKAQLDAQLAASEWAASQKKASADTTAANQLTKKAELDNYDLLLDRKAELKNNTDQQKEYARQLKEGEISLGTYNEKVKQLIIQEKELKYSIGQINADIKNQTKLDFATPGSKAEAEANNIILRKERDATDVNDVERIAELNRLIDENNKLIDENSDKLGRQKINIGNYPTAFAGAFKFLNDELASVEGKLAGPGLSGKEIENLSVKQEALRNATALVGKEFSSTTAQQNAFKEAATQIGLVFGKDSETFKQFNSQVQAGKAELDSVKGAMTGAEAAGNKFGKALGGIWSGIRQIAYAIPGIGLAGLVGLLLTPLEAIGKSFFTFARNTDSAKKATDEFVKSLETEGTIFDEAKGKYSDVAANVAELKEDVLLAKQGFIDKDLVVKQYNETMGKTVGTVKDLDQVEQQLVQNGEAYIKFTLFKAAAQVAYQKAAEKAFEAEQTRRKKEIEFQNLGDKALSGDEGFFSSAAPSRSQVETQRYITEQQKKRRQTQVDAAEKEKKELQDIADKFEKDAAEISKKFHFNFFGNGKEDTALKEYLKKFFDQELKAQQDAYTRISQSDTVYLDTRLEARKRAYEFEFQIIEGQKNYELAVEKNKLDSVINNAKATKNEKINARREYATRIAEIDERVDFQEKEAARKLSIDLGVIRRKQVDDDIALIKKEQEEIAELDKKKLEAELKAEQDRIKRRQDQDAINQDTELRVLDLEYQKKLISEEEYQKKKFQIERYYSLKSQTDTIADLERQIQRAKNDGKDTLDLERKIADEKKKIDDELTKKLIDNREKLIAREKEFAQTVIGAVQSLVDNGYERQKNALQDQIDLIDSKKQKEIDGVNASVASEQDKAAKIAIINQRTEDQKAELQKKQREQDIKKAQFDKLIGILQVGVSTQRTIADLAAKAAIAKAEASVLAANPVTAAYAPIAFASAAAIAAQIPLALAQGAIQAGLIAAQPIPKYRTGTGYHPGGLMYAGDGGKSEIVIPPGGNAFTTPSVATLYDMPRGTIVLPDANQAIEQSFNMMYKPVLPALAAGEDLQVKMLSKKMDAVINAINNIPGTKVVNTWSGVNTSYENVSRLWEYINNNTQSR